MTCLSIPVSNIRMCKFSCRAGVTMQFLSPQRWNLQLYQTALRHTLNSGLVLVSLILIKSVSTGAEICCRFCQAIPSDPYRLVGCGTVSLTVSYQRTNNVESTLIQRHDIETIPIQHCCVASGKPFQNIGVGRFRKLGRGGKVENIEGANGAKFPAGT